MTAPFELVLCDLDAEIVREWRRAFAGYDAVDVQQGDLLDVDATAYVSPANSYGIMDGGIDAALRGRFPSVERRVQSAIAATGAPLPVGRALVVDTGDIDVPYLVCAPTMERPMRVPHSRNAYEAMLALLVAVVRFNEENEGVIEAVAVPGLCTGVGAMPAAASAAQMAAAYQDWLAGRPTA